MTIINKIKIDERVTYSEPSDILDKISKTIIKQGYRIYNTDLDNDLLYIQKLEKGTKRGIFGQKLKDNYVRIGELWLDNKPREAVHDKNWVLEIYKKVHVEELKKLAQELAKTYNVNVHVSLGPAA